MGEFLEQATEEERSRLIEDEQLNALREQPGWPVFQRRVQERVLQVFKDFMNADPQVMLSMQGAANALWDMLKEVDCAAARQEELRSGVQARYEQAVAQEREESRARARGFSGASHWSSRNPALG